ncbi:MAG: hypothetical protein AAGD10_14825 [Myxococcota bacterium]
MKLLPTQSLPGVVDEGVDAIVRSRRGGEVQETFFVPKELADHLDQNGIFDLVAASFGPDMRPTFDRKEGLSFGRKPSLLRASEHLGVDIERFGDEGARVRLGYRSNRGGHWIGLGSLASLLVIYPAAAGFFLGVHPWLCLGVAAGGLAMQLSFFLSAPLVDVFFGRSASEARLGSFRQALLDRLRRPVGAKAAGRASALRLEARQYRGWLGRSSTLALPDGLAEGFGAQRLQETLSAFATAVEDSIVVQDKRLVLSSDKSFGHYGRTLRVEVVDEAGETALRTEDVISLWIFILPVLVSLPLMFFATRHLGMAFWVYALLGVPLASVLTRWMLDGWSERRLRAVEQSVLEAMLASEALPEPGASTKTSAEVDSVDAVDPVEHVMP